MHSNPYAQEDIQDRLQSLNHKWEELNHKMADGGDRLPQTRQQDQLLELIQVSGECGVGAGTQGGRPEFGWDRMGRTERAGESGLMKSCTKLCLREG